MRVKKAYLKAVVRTLPRGFYLRSYVLRDLARSIDFLLVCQPDADLATLEAEFGKPEEFVRTFLCDADPAEIARITRRRQILAALLTVAGVLMIVGGFYCIYQITRPVDLGYYGVVTMSHGGVSNYG